MLGSVLVALTLIDSPPSNIGNPYSRSSHLQISFQIFTIITSEFFVVATPSARLRLLDSVALLVHI